MHMIRSRHVFTLAVIGAMVALVRQPPFGL